MTISGEVNFEVDTGDVQLRRQIVEWTMRPDKPFTRSSLTIRDVASELGISKNRLSLYINSMNTNFRSWINDLRIEEARRMLVAQRDMPLVEVAEAVGFCDLPAFSHVFKKVVGVTPKAFRNNAINAGINTLDTD